MRQLSDFRPAADSTTSANGLRRGRLAAIVPEAPVGEVGFDPVSAAQ